MSDENVRRFNVLKFMATHMEHCFCDPPCDIQDSEECAQTFAIMSETEISNMVRSMLMYLRLLLAVKTRYRKQHERIENREDWSNSAQNMPVSCTPSRVSAFSAHASLWLCRCIH